MQLLAIVYCLLLNASPDTKHAGFYGGLVVPLCYMVVTASKYVELSYMMMQ